MHTLTSQSVRPYCSRLCQNLNQRTFNRCWQYMACLNLYSSKMCSAKKKLLWMRWQSCVAREEMLRTRWTLIVGGVDNSDHGPDKANVIPPLQTLLLWPVQARESWRIGRVQKWQLTKWSRLLYYNGPACTIAMSALGLTTIYTCLQ